MDGKERSETMSSTVHAIYEKGVFRPVEPVDLPENTPVEFEPRVLTEAGETDAPSMSEGLAKIYEILGRRYNSGYTDTAARHNEHQP
jgi:predicted DNA-binding antitoxin AbrB/MazE fold protein